MYKRVFIVAEGGWGSVEPEEYKESAAMYQRVLEEARDSQGNKAAVVEVIDTVAEAERRFKGEADVLVFVSRGREMAAERIARENPKVRVVVFTGSIPAGKVIWAQKAFTADMKTIENIVLYW